jgi:hypothetical protein
MMKEYEIKMKKMRQRKIINSLKRMVRRRRKKFNDEERKREK